MSLAPCIAVVGPANAGKTTILHQIDERLKPLLDSFLVIKGNPDGTGRYMYHAPDLRQKPDFKASVKGKWGGATVDRICEWVIHGRRNLSLALLDFGGRHDAQTAEGNDRMLDVCSHYLVVSREQDRAGAQFWDEICRSRGLVPLGHMRSLPKGCPPPAPGTFQVDIDPGDPINDASLAPLIETLQELSVAQDLTPYINLRQSGDWRVEQIADVAGQAGKIQELASRTGVVVLGGPAPVWDHLAGLRCAIKARADVRVFFFDPKQPERLVQIPSRPGEGPAQFPPDSLKVFCRLSRLSAKIASRRSSLPIPSKSSGARRRAGPFCIWRLRRPISFFRPRPRRTSPARPFRLRLR